MSGAHCMAGRLMGLGAVLCCHRQMLISANGHHKVPFPDLIVAGKVGWKVSSRQRCCSPAIEHHEIQYTPLSTLTQSLRE
jgi:hypothetical protein